MIDRLPELKKVRHFIVLRIWQLRMNLCQIINSIIKILMNKMLTKIKKELTINLYKTSNQSDK